MICDQNWVKFPLLVSRWCHKVFGSLLAVTLSFDLWTPKSNQHIYETNSSVPKIWWNSLHWFVTYCIYSVFRVIACCDLDIWPLTQDLISISAYPSTYVAKIEWNSLHWFLTCGVHKVFGTHKLMHSQTDRSDYRMPPVPFVNGGGGIIRRNTLHWLQLDPPPTSHLIVRRPWSAPIITDHTIHSKDHRSPT